MYSAAARRLAKAGAASSSFFQQRMLQQESWGPQERTEIGYIPFDNLVSKRHFPVPSVAQSEAVLTTGNNTTALNMHDAYQRHAVSVRADARPTQFPAQRCGEIITMEFDVVLHQSSLIGTRRL